MSENVLDSSVPVLQDSGEILVARKWLAFNLKDIPILRVFRCLKSGLVFRLLARDSKTGEILAVGEDGTPWSGQPWSEVEMLMEL